MLMTEAMQSVKKEWLDDLEECMNRSERNVEGARKGRGERRSGPLILI